MEDLPMMFIRIVLLALLLLSWPVYGAGDSGGVWIDVRSVDEYAAGHIEAHPNIPYGDIGASIGEIVPDKSTPIRVYCKSGRRSGIAQETLINMGYTNVVNMGGYDTVKANLDAAPTTD
jgi:phage shock protein E